MKERVSLRQALDGRVVVGQEGGPRPGTPLAVILRMGPDGLPRPVDVVRALTRGGVTLRKGHLVLTRLTHGATVPLELPTVADAAALRGELEALGVHVDVPRPVPLVDLPALRRRLDLTQEEFAIAYGFELDSVRNWEQGRSVPEHPARLLLALIERRPGLVEGVLRDIAAVPSPADGAV